MQPAVTAALLAAIAVAGCGGEEENASPVARATHPAVDLVSPRHDDAVLGQAGWAHGQSASGDFDGDGAA